jgi:hypothetical protein
MTLRACFFLTLHWREGKDGDGLAANGEPVIFFGQLMTLMLFVFAPQTR